MLYATFKAIKCRLSLVSDVLAFSHTATPEITFDLAIKRSTGLEKMFEFVLPDMGVVAM